MSSFAGNLGPAMLGRDALSAGGCAGAGRGGACLGPLWGRLFWVVFWLRFFLGGIKLIIVSCGFVRYGPGFFVLAWKSVTSSTVTRPLRSTVFWKGSPETYVSSQDGTCYLLFCPCYLIVFSFCSGCSALAAWTRVSPVCSFLLPCRVAAVLVAPSGRICRVFLGCLSLFKCGLPGLCLWKPLQID